MPELDLSKCHCGGELSDGCMIGQRWSGRTCSVCGDHFASVGELERSHVQAQFARAEAEKARAEEALALVKILREDNTAHTERIRTLECQLTARDRDCDGQKARADRAEAALRVIASAYDAEAREAAERVWEFSGSGETTSVVAGWKSVSLAWEKAAKMARQALAGEAVGK